MQPTTEANQAYEVIRNLSPLVKTIFRGGFFLITFNLFIMKKKKILKVLSHLMFELQLMQAKNQEKKNPCILEHLTISCCLENAQFLEEFVRNYKKYENGK